MKQLVLTSKFKSSYPKFTHHDKKLRERIDETLHQMEQDVFLTSLSTHKLSGTLHGFWACSCGYDCRIVFSIEIDPTSQEEVNVLLDIGTHDEVY